MVAWCTQARNEARVIPDGTFTAVHLVRTPLYIQVQGWGDFTKINIADGDEGGELDPHGATGDGNPIGGNVTSNISGSDVHYQEWMNYMSYQQFCLRICVSENSTYSAAVECQHTLDEMGCNWVMPGDYTNNSFTDCEGDSAYPPGVYPQADGSTSTFAQRYTGTYTAGGSVGTYTIGQTVTPQTAYSTPATSSCTTYATISNGIALSSLGVSGSIATVSGASGSAASASATSASGSGSASASGKSSASGSASGSASKSASASSSASSGAAFRAAGEFSYGPMVVSAFTVVAVLAGAGAVAL